MKSMTEPNRKTSKGIDQVAASYFWFGLTVYSMSFATYASQTIDKRICVSLQLVGLLVMTISGCFLIDIRGANSYLKKFLSVYLIWTLIMIWRGYNTSFSFWKQMLFYPFNGILLYLVPIIILFRKPLLNLKYAANGVTILGLAFAALAILSYKGLIFNYEGRGQSLIEYYAKTLSLPSGFLLLTYAFHKRKNNLLALLVILITIAIAIIRARRGIVLIYSGMLISGAVVMVYLNRNQGLLKFYASLTFMLLIILSTQIFNNVIKSDFFSAIESRLSEDTRSDVERYFYEDMKGIDWIIGKGINGMYYAPTGEEENVNSPFRDGIETDYLTIILKGGIISLGLILLIALPAAIKGFFQSNNLLCKGCAIWIILWLIELYPTNVTTFTMNYFLVWVSIQICFSKAIRKLTNSEIKSNLESLDTSSKINAFNRINPSQ